MKIAMLALLILSFQASTQIDPQAIVGKYHIKEEGIAIDVNLNADCTALYYIGGQEGIRAVGLWSTRGDRIHIYNKPGPVRLEATGAPTRDPKVAFRIVARLPDGSPADGLIVRWPGAAGSYYLSDGKKEASLDEGPVVGTMSIQRAADNKELATFVMKAGAANSYRSTYHPSDVEPFDFEARSLGADMLEVEGGSASATLRRVRD